MQRPMNRRVTRRGKIKYRTPNSIDIQLEKSRKEIEQGLGVRCTDDKDFFRTLNE